jgi:FtsH-binding integral membrane protein
MTAAETATHVAAWVVAVVVAAFGLVVIVQMLRGKIRLDDILSEPGTPGSASLAKLQFLIFTFVVALSLFVITIQKQEFPEIKPGILVLLGISAGSSLVSSGISASMRVRLAEVRARARMHDSQVIVDDL